MIDPHTDALLRALRLKEVKLIASDDTRKGRGRMWTLSSGHCLENPQEHWPWSEGPWVDSACFPSTQLLQEVFPVNHSHLRLHHSPPYVQSLCMTLLTSGLSVLINAFYQQWVIDWLFTVWAAPKSFPLDDCLCVPTFPSPPPFQPQDPDKAWNLYTLVEKQILFIAKRNLGNPGWVITGWCLSSC